MVRYRRLRSPDATQLSARLAPVFSIEPSRDLQVYGASIWANGQPQECASDAERSRGDGAERDRGRAHERPRPHASSTPQ